MSTNALSARYADDMRRRVGRRIFSHLCKTPIRNIEFEIVFKEWRDSVTLLGGSDPASIRVLTDSEADAPKVIKSDVKRLSRTIELIRLKPEQDELFPAPLMTSAPPPTKIYIEQQPDSSIQRLSLPPEWPANDSHVETPVKARRVHLKIRHANEHPFRKNTDKIDLHLDESQTDTKELKESPSKKVRLDLDCTDRNLDGDNIHNNPLPRKAESLPSPLIGHSGHEGNTNHLSDPVVLLAPSQYDPLPSSSSTRTMNQTTSHEEFRIRVEHERIFAPIPERLEHCHVILDEYSTRLRGKLREYERMKIKELMLKDARMELADSIEADRNYIKQLEASAKEKERYSRYVEE